MTKREIYRIGKIRIKKQGQSHQTVFESLAGDDIKTNKLIADTLKMIPSKRIIKKYKYLKIFFIVTLSGYLLMILGAIISIYSRLGAYTYKEVFSYNFMIVFGVISLMIFGAIKNLKIVYIITASLFSIFLFISLDYGFKLASLGYMFSVLLNFLIVVFGFATANMLNTPYKIIFLDKIVNGTKINDFNFEFTDDKLDDIQNNLDVLDDHF